LQREVPNLPAEVNWLLEEGYFGYLGTSDSQGAPQVTPVIFVQDGNSVFFMASKISKKCNNIRQNERVAFLVDIRDPSDLANNRAVLIEGRAKIYGISDVLNGLGRVPRVRASLHKKCPKYAAFYAEKGAVIPKPWRRTLFISRLLVEVSIDRFTYMREARPVALGKVRR
jgi:hypothetical protein